MGMAYGGGITLDKAIELGVLNTAEALISQGPDRPMKALAPVDNPVEIKSGDDMPTNNNVSLHRALNHLNKGGLHRALGISEDQPIPEDRLEAAKHSSNPHVAHMAHFAAVMSKFKH